MINYPPTNPQSLKQQQITYIKYIKENTLQPFEYRPKEPSHHQTNRCNRGPSKDKCQLLLFIRHSIRFPLLVKEGKTWTFRF